MNPFSGLIILKVFVALVVVLVLVRAANHYHGYAYFYQYLFFCRFPLLFGVLLVVLPLLSVGPASKLLGNLFELGFWGVGVAAFIAVFTSWIILFTLTRTLEIAPAKTGLSYLRKDYSCEGTTGTTALSTVSRRLRLLCHLGKVVLGEERYPARRLLYAGLLGAPFLCTLIFYSSWIEGQPRFGVLLWNAVGAGGGITVAVLLRWLFTYLQKQKDWHTLRAAGPFRGVSTFILRRFFRLDVNRLPAAVRVKQAQAVFFAGMAFMIYALTGLVALPEWPEAAYGLVPSIGLILMLVWLYCFAFSLLAVALDSYRVPVLTVALVGLGVYYGAMETDYTYALKPPTADPAFEDEPLAPEAALAAWHGGRGAAANAMVVVAASGGGITAAQWTAEVLTRLHQDLFPHFGQALVLLSTTSGGSAGAMYYVDRFPELVAPATDAVTYDSVRTMASLSSLNAAAHGLVYGDVWRFLPGAQILLRDRGNALEDLWERRLRHPEASVLGWGQDVAAGLRPVHVFNTTMAETGNLFMISPLQHDDRHDDRYVHFRKLYPNHDLGVATAARLSATFPFISPQARPSRFQVEGTTAYHLADGGYFDNQGLLGALTFLDDAYSDSARADTTLPKQVLLLQIRAFEQEEQQAEPDMGWKYAFLGPFVTVLRMRSAAQQNRGAMEEDLFNRLFEESRNVEVETVSFSLRREDAPLSWHLTEANRESIRCAWNNQEEAFEAVANVLLGDDATPVFVEVEGCEDR